MESKQPMQSKTILYQVISAMLVVLIGGISVLEEILPTIYIVVILLGLKVIDAGINTYLRLITDTPIKSPLNS